MMTCDNCSGPVNDFDDSLVTRSRGRVVTSICGSCLGGSETVKVVLRRGEEDRFKYEQFSVLKIQPSLGKAG
jgi:hypothetical protein